VPNVPLLSRQFSLRTSCVIIPKFVRTMKTIASVLLHLGAAAVLALVFNGSKLRLRCLRNPPLFACQFPRADRSDSRPVCLRTHYKSRQRRAALQYAADLVTLINVSPLSRIL